MNKFIVEYCPNISEKAEKIIIENITPSMSSIDGDSHQYCLDFIISDILNDLPKEDQDTILILKSENVDYIEM
jgi:hypothetical protein